MRFIPLRNLAMQWHLVADPENRSRIVDCKGGHVDYIFLVNPRKSSDPLSKRWRMWSLQADISTHHVTRAKVFPDGVCSCAVSRGNLVMFPVSLIVMTSSLLASLMNMRTATGEQPTQQQQHVVVKIDSENKLYQNLSFKFKVSKPGFQHHHLSAFLPASHRSNSNRVPADLLVAWTTHRFLFSFYCEILIPSSTNGRNMKKREYRATMEEEIIT